MSLEHPEDRTLENFRKILEELEEGQTRFILGLQELKERFHPPTESSSPSTRALILISLEGIVLAMDAGAPSLYGLPPQAMVGRLYEERIPEASREEWRNLLAAAREGLPTSDPASPRWAPGREFRVKHHMIPLLNGDGQILALALWDEHRPTDPGSLPGEAQGISPDGL